jgi:hypothetical protein
MKRAPQWTLGALLVTACLLVASRTVAFAFSVWPDDLNQPSLYIIEGYIDRASAQATIRDRIDISAHGQRRTLLVTRYGTPGEMELDRYLSRVMAQPFVIRGTSENVERLVKAPSGTKIAGTFAAYTHRSPWLLIGDLTTPDASS